MVGHAENERAVAEDSNVEEPPQTPVTEALETAEVLEVMTGPNEVQEITGGSDEQTVPSKSVAAEIDADLATTLGHPKIAEKPTGNLGRLLGAKSMLGMSAQDTSQEEEELSDTTNLNQAYDEDRVKAVWSALVEEQKTKNKMGLAATLATAGWSFEDPLIKLTVANQVQYDELKECATQLLHFMRTEVGNGRIALEVEVSEVVAEVEFLTPKDRYYRWAEENPALDSLRKRLDLDLG